MVLAARVLSEFGDDPHRYVDAKARKAYAALRREHGLGPPLQRNRLTTQNPGCLPSSGRRQMLVVVSSLTVHQRDRLLVTPRVCNRVEASAACGGPAACWPD